MLSYGFFRKFQVATVTLEITTNIEKIASIVIMNSFGSTKVRTCELLRYIDNKINAMNNEFAKFAANKKIPSKLHPKKPRKINFVAKLALNKYS
jgi:translation elongation factor EF-1alpha